LLSTVNEALAADIEINDGSCVLRSTKRKMRRRKKFEGEMRIERQLEEWWKNGKKSGLKNVRLVN
jgi:hypothetical protein